MLRSLGIKLPTLLLATAAFVWLDGATGVLVGIGILLLGIGLLLLAVMHPNSSAWVRTFWRAPRATDAVALTFDDGPDPEITPRVLDILEAHGVRAAFFVVGERARQNPELVARLHEAGHVVGNHSDTHGLDFHFRLWGRFREELRGCNEAIAAVLGRQPTLFRAPQGHKNPALGDVLGELDMTPIGWQVRGLDGVSTNADAIERRVVEGAKPGGVILLHDGSWGDSSDRSATAEALPRIIAGLRARGLRFERLDALLELQPYRSDAV